MDDMRDEISRLKPGCLITQISYGEFKDLIVRLLDESLDLNSLYLSERKKERVEAKKLTLLGSLIQQPPQILSRLLSTKWQTLFFRMTEDGIQTELLHKKE